MRALAFLVLLVCVGCDAGPSPPPEVVVGDPTVFRDLGATVSVSDVVSAQSQRLLVDVDVGPLDATTGTVPGLSILLQGQPMPLVDANPDLGIVPGEVRRQIFKHELAPSEVPDDRVLRFTFEYRGSRVQQHVALAPRIVIQTPGNAVSATHDELALSWTPDLGADRTTVGIRTVHYASNPTTVSSCKVLYAEAVREPGRAVFTRTLDPSEYAKAPPCTGWANVDVRLDDMVAGTPFESFRLRSSQHVGAEFTVTP
jgi:hypothetical protein